MWVVKPQGDSFAPTVGSSPDAHVQSRSFEKYIFQLSLYTYQINQDEQSKIRVDIPQINDTVYYSPCEVTRQTKFGVVVDDQGW